MHEDYFNEFCDKSTRLLDIFDKIVLIIWSYGVITSFKMQYFTFLAIHSTRIPNFDRVVFLKTFIYERKLPVFGRD